jgi:hypothetical protein
MNHIHAVLESETAGSFNILAKRNQTLKYWGIGISLFLMILNLIRLLMIQNLA